jgi:hypothetical protein
VIKDTAYNLKIHMQRIDEKMVLFKTESLDTSDTSINLEDEKVVTEQCLRICENARSHIESLTDQELTLQQNTPLQPAGGRLQNPFEAQRLTRQALDDERDHFVEIIGRLRERLEILTSNGGGASDRQRLQEDINASKQCLEVCKLASTEVNQQKIYCIGEVIADDDSDQMVVTTLADLFDIKKALSKGKSAQLVGSMRDETLRQVSKDRYNSRFGAATTASTSNVETRKTNGWLPQQAAKEGQPLESEARHSRPSPNETRKRMTEGDN